VFRADRQRVTIRASEMVNRLAGNAGKGHVGRRWRLTQETVGGRKPHRIRVRSQELVQRSHGICRRWFSRDGRQGEHTQGLPEHDRPFEIP
jgi:hypothetical protein